MPRKTDMECYMQGVAAFHAGVPRDQVKGKMARKGWDDASIGKDKGGKGGKPSELRTNGRVSRAHRLERITESLAPMREHKGKEFTPEEVSRLISGIHVLVRHHPEQGDMITATLLLKLLKMQAKR